MTTSTTNAKILSVLSRHVGHGHGIGVGPLARLADVPEREVRRAVSALREEGVSVCAHPTTGYFLAANDKELDDYCIKFLKDRALHSLRLASRLKNIALPEMMGQLKLET
ncbi:MAG TPA: hypothetical protein VF928_09395 [Usitatibacteraceae bacterium]